MARSSCGMGVPVLMTSNKPAHHVNCCEGKCYRIQPRVHRIGVKIIQYAHQQHWLRQQAVALRSTSVCIILARAGRHEQKPLSPPAVLTQHSPVPPTVRLFTVVIKQLFDQFLQIALLLSRMLTTSFCSGVSGPTTDQPVIQCPRAYSPVAFLIHR